MAISRYDVLKRHCGGLLWIEAVDGCGIREAPHPGAKFRILWRVFRF